MRRARAPRMVLAALVAAAALFAAYAAPAGALLRAVSADHLARTAQTIVLARAVSTQSYRSADPVPAGALGGPIVTDVRLRVHEVLKGAAAAAMTLTVPGGRVGGMGLTCPDAPSFQRGLTYLVYLDADGHVVAWRRGQPLVVGGRVPELGKTLKQIERHVAQLTGRRATVYSRPSASATAAGAAVRVTSGSATSSADRSGSGAYLVLPTTAGGGSAASRVGAPVIAGILPGSAPAGTGDVVTIAGSGFGAAQGGGKVWFFYQQPDPNTNPTLIDAPVVSWTDSAIACVVPTAIIDDYAASAGSGPVYVSLNASTFSNGYPFAVSFSYGGEQWPRNKCRFRVNTAGHDDWALAVRQAAATWTALSAGGFRFVDAGKASASSSPVEDGYDDIVWGPLDDPDVIAAAWTYDIGHAILETDIVFNTYYTWGTGGGPTEMDVETIAVHELGHWLNLRDLYGPAGSAGPGDTAKIMYGFCDFGVVKRTPDPADQAGVLWIYAASRRDTQRPTSTVAKAETVRRGRVVDLHMLVNDPEYSCGAAAVRVVITDRSGHTAMRISGWGVPTNEWSYIPYKCKLPRGVYRWRVQATDMTGRRQIKMGSAKLVVR